MRDNGPYGIRSYLDRTGEEEVAYRFTPLAPPREKMVDVTRACGLLLFVLLTLDIYTHPVPRLNIPPSHSYRCYLQYIWNGYIRVL